MTVLEEMSVKALKRRIDLLRSDYEGHGPQ